MTRTYNEPDLKTTNLAVIKLKAKDFLENDKGFMNHSEVAESLLFSNLSWLQET